MGYRIFPGFSPLHFTYTVYYSESAISASLYLLSKDMLALWKVHNVSKRSYSRPSAMPMTLKDVSLIVCTGFGKLIEYAEFAVTK